ncbi:MAG: hypothetical protein Kapaf2KO_03500 [Candidatus Kapaibacteriales bacterium]
MQLKQLRTVDVCEGDGKGDIQVIVDIGSISSADNLESFEISIAYQEEDLRIQLPVLKTNTLSQQIPENQTSVQVFSETSEVYISAFKFGGGISGNRPLIGFRVTDNRDCEENGELKITSFWVNEECTLEFEIDSTLTVLRQKSEDFISQVEVTSEISSLTNKEDGGKFKVDINATNDKQRIIDTLGYIVNVEGDTESWSVAESDTVTIVGTVKVDTYFEDFNMPVSNSKLGQLYFKYVGDEETSDSIDVTIEPYLIEGCQCAEMSAEKTTYRMRYLAPTSVNETIENYSVVKVIGDKVFSENKGHVLIARPDGRLVYNGVLDENGIKLRNGTYLIRTDDLTKKIIINNF